MDRRAGEFDLRNDSHHRCSVRSELFLSRLCALSLTRCSGLLSSMHSNSCSSQRLAQMELRPPGQASAVSHGQPLASWRRDVSACGSHYCKVCLPLCMWTSCVEVRANHQRSAGGGTHQLHTTLTGGVRGSPYVQNFTSPLLTSPSSSGVLHARSDLHYPHCVQEHTSDPRAASRPGIQTEGPY